MSRDRLRRQLIDDEGLKLSAYQDHLGFWTIGIGRLIDARKGGGISLTEAHYLLDNDINQRVKELAGALPWFLLLDLVRQSALVMMAFQLGTAGLLGFKRAMAAMAAGDYDAAERLFLKSKWAKQTPERAKRTARMIRTGAWE